MTLFMLKILILSYHIQISLSYFPYYCGCNYANGCFDDSSCCSGLICISNFGYSQCQENPLYTKPSTTVPACLHTNTDWGCRRNTDCCNPSAICSPKRICVFNQTCTMNYRSALPSGKPTTQPSTTPSAQPTNPSVIPSRQPFECPTHKPSHQPSRQPSKQPNGKPSCQPSSQPSSPSSQPSYQPSRIPSCQPSSNPTQPTAQPTNQPTKVPSTQPHVKPSSSPTVQPLDYPSKQPITSPSVQPSTCPSTHPTGQPFLNPTTQPTVSPSVIPSQQPRLTPSHQPTLIPSKQPSKQPLLHPTKQPENFPTYQPSKQPNSKPTNRPSVQPSTQPSIQPSSSPTHQPSRQPQHRPTSQPSHMPSKQPIHVPTNQPSRQPSRQPSTQPTSQPSSPTQQPTSQPSKRPTRLPSVQPNCHPTKQPSKQPTANHPSRQPFRHPSHIPSSQPFASPTHFPSKQPTRQPTRQPTTQPSSQPHHIPSTQPSVQPSLQPTGQPTKYVPPGAIPWYKTAVFAIATGTVFGSICVMAACFGFAAVYVKESRKKKKKENGNSTASIKEDDNASGVTFDMYPQERMDFSNDDIQWVGPSKMLMQHYSTRKFAIKSMSNKDLNDVLPTLSKDGKDTKTSALLAENAAKDLLPTIPLTAQILPAQYDSTAEKKSNIDAMAKYSFDQLYETYAEVEEKETLNPVEKSLGTGQVLLKESDRNNNKENLDTNISVLGLVNKPIPSKREKAIGLVPEKMDRTLSAINISLMPPSPRIKSNHSMISTSSCINESITSTKVSTPDAQKDVSPYRNPYAFYRSIVKDESVVEVPQNHLVSDQVTQEQPAVHFHQMQKLDFLSNVIQKQLEKSEHVLDLSDLYPDDDAGRFQSVQDKKSPSTFIMSYKSTRNDQQCFSKSTQNVPSSPTHTTNFVRTSMSPVAESNPQMISNRNPEALKQRSESNKRNPQSQEVLMPASVAKPALTNVAKVQHNSANTLTTIKPSNPIPSVRAVEGNTQSEEHKTSTPIRNAQKLESETNVGMNTPTKISTDNVLSPHSEQFRQARLKFESLSNQKASGGLSASQIGLANLQLGNKVQETKQKFEFLIEKNLNSSTSDMKRSGRLQDGRFPDISPQKPLDVTPRKFLYQTSPAYSDSNRSRTDNQETLKQSLRDKMDHTPTNKYPAYIPSIEKQSMREERVPTLQYKSPVTGSLPQSILYSPPPQECEASKHQSRSDSREASPFRTLSKSRSQSPSTIKSQSHMYFDANSMDDFDSEDTNAHPPKATPPEISPYEAYRRLQAKLSDTDSETAKPVVLTDKPNKVISALPSASLSTPLIEIKSLSTLQSRARATSDFRLNSMMQTSPLRREPPSNSTDPLRQNKLADQNSKSALALKSTPTKTTADGFKGNTVTDMYEKVLVKYFSPTDTKELN